MPKRLRAAGLLMVMTIGLLTGNLFFGPFVDAASGEIDPDGDGSSGNWNSTGASFFTEIDEAIRFPSTPDTSDYVFANSQTGGSIFFDMETISTNIYVVTRIRVGVYHLDGANGQLNIQLFESNETTPLSSEISLTRQTSPAWGVADFTNLVLTPSQLDSLKVRIRASKPDAGAGNNVFVAEMYALVDYENEPIFDQVGYRFFANANSTDVGTPLGAQNASVVLANAGDAFRLRILVDVSAGAIPLGYETFKLQYVDPGSGDCANPSGGTPAVYTDVTGSTLIAYNDNSNPADEDNLTPNVNDPTNGGDTIQNQTYQESNNLSNSANAIPAGDSAMWDFSLRDNGAPTSTTYCLGVLLADGTVFSGYTEFPQVTTAGGVLSVDIVDASGNTVASPSRNMSGTSFNFDCTTTTGRIGVSQERIRVDNQTSNPAWALSIAATAGPTANWQDGTNNYDFNDPGGTPQGCGDGGDADGLAGQLSMDFSSAVNVPQTGCSSTGISYGSNTAFNEGSVDSITLASASSSADTGCFWDFGFYDVSQTIPPEQIEGNYTINFTVTVISI